MKLLLVVFLIFSTLNLASCGGSAADLRYLDSRVMQNLEVPPDLTLNVVGSNFELPAAFSVDGAVKGGAMPVLPGVTSIKLEGQGDFYWLSIDEPVDNLYQLVKDFWASEGFTLAMDEPVIGIMKTNWIFKEEGGKDAEEGFFASLFSNNLSRSQDQFKTRIARDDETSTNQIYISHRGTESRQVLTRHRDEDVGRAEVNFQATKQDWNFRAFEPELEVEMLSRLMIYLGLRQSEVDGQLANIKLFSPRASIHTEFTSGGDEGEEIDGTYLLVKDTYAQTWYRTLHQLDRLGFNVISADISGGISNNGVIRVETDIEQKSAGFLSFFSSRKTINKKQIKLIFSDETHEITRIAMEMIKGEKDDSAVVEEFAALLYQHLK